MTFGFGLFTFARLCLMRSLNAAWAAGPCHIHPLGMDMEEAESRVTEWYGSLEECEIANKKFYGGSGMCHCFSGWNFQWNKR
jgi:hypothetical protein